MYRFGVIYHQWKLLPCTFSLLIFDFDWIYWEYISIWDFVTLIVFKFYQYAFRLVFLRICSFIVNNFFDHPLRTIVQSHTYIHIETKINFSAHWKVQLVFKSHEIIVREILIWLWIIDCWKFVDWLVQIHYLIHVVGFGLINRSIEPQCIFKGFLFSLWESTSISGFYFLFTLLWYLIGLKFFKNLVELDNVLIIWIQSHVFG